MWDWIAKANELQTKMCPFALVTIVESRGSAPRDSGTKMIVTPDGEFYGTIGGGQVEKSAIEDALVCLQEEASKVINYKLTPQSGQCCGGDQKVFIEIFGNHPRFYLFGAGHVGLSLCQTLEGTPFHVTLIDERTEWLERAKEFEGVKRVQLVSPEQTIASLNFDDKKTYVAVMTHSHELDFKLLKELLKKETKFLGVIGSQNKWRRFQENLTKHGFTAEEMERITCPLGFPIGGKAPKEVAISLASQLLSLHYNEKENL